MGKTDLTWGNEFNLLPIKSEWGNDKQIQNLKTPSPTLPFFLGNAGGQGSEVEISSSHIVSATPSSSGGGLLALCPCSIVGSLPRETVVHELLQCESFPQGATLHELLQHGSLSWSAVLQKRAAPRGHKSCQQTCSSVGSCLHGSTCPGRSLLQCWVSTGSQPPWGISLLLCGVLPRLQMEICSTVDLHGLQGTACLTMVFSAVCRRISAPTPGVPPPPPSSLTLESAELFLSHILTLFWLLFHSNFSPPSNLCYPAGATNHF